MLKGIPEYNFPKLQPLEIPVFEVNNEVGNIVSVDAKFKNVIMKGFENLIIEQAT